MTANSELSATPETLKANFTVRILYIAALLAFAPSLLVGSSGWIALALGSGLVSGVGSTVVILVFAIILFRSYLVLRYPTTLDSRTPNIAGKFLRASGIFAMFIGVLAGVGLFLVKPITLAIFNSAGDGGIGYFVVGIYLVILANLGWIGCFIFELSRVLGAKPPAAEKKSRTTRRQDIAVLATLIAGAIALPLFLQQTREKPCGENNLAACVSKTESVVRRVIAVSSEDQIALNSNIEEVVMRRNTGGHTWNLIENPMTSLAAMGHSISPSSDTRIRVNLEATTSFNGITLLLTVKDGEEETARFTTNFGKDASLETTPDGKVRIIAPLQPNARPGMRPMKKNPVTQKEYSLDQIFIHLRKAIGNELEAREWPQHIERPAVLVTDKIETHPSYEDAHFSASCLNKISNGPSQAISFETEIGWNLQGVTFTTSPIPGPHALLGGRDVVSCHDDEVWIVSYMTRRPDLRIRRYTIDGQILRFVDTSIPPASLGSHEYERVDPSSIREEGNKIHFERVILKTNGGLKSTEVKREMFSIYL